MAIEPRFLPQPTTWVDRFVEEGKALLEEADEDVINDYLQRATTRMKEEGTPRPRKDLHSFKPRIQTINMSTGAAHPSKKATKAQLVEDVETTISRLLDWKERLMDPLSNARGAHYEMNNSNTNNIDIVMTGESSSSSVAANLTFAVARKNIDALDDEVLTREERLILKALLLEIEEANEETMGEKVMDVVRFIGDKTFEVAKAVLPALASHMLGA